jgi:hypothetical protein
MKLREFKFNELKNPLSPVNLCVKDEKRIYEECSIGETLRSLPLELADREIKEARWFFNTLVIELEEAKDG